MIYSASKGDLKKKQWIEKNCTIPDLIWLSDMKRFEGYSHEKQMDKKR